MPELVNNYGMAESNVVEFAHAIDACDVGKHFDPDLRIKILEALGASRSVIEENTRLFPKVF